MLVATGMLPRSTDVVALSAVTCAAVSVSFDPIVSACNAVMSEAPDAATLSSVVATLDCAPKIVAASATVAVPVAWIVPPEATWPANVASSVEPIPARWAAVSTMPENVTVSPGLPLACAVRMSSACCAVTVVVMLSAVTPCSVSGLLDAVSCASSCVAVSVI